MEIVTVIQKFIIIFKLQLQQRLSEFYQQRLMSIYPQGLMSLLNDFLFQLINFYFFIDLIKDLIQIRNYQIKYINELLDKQYLVRSSFQSINQRRLYDQIIKNMQSKVQTNQTPLIVKYGSKVFNFEPGTLLFNLFMKELGIAQPKKIKYAFIDKLMKFNAASFWGNDKQANCNLLDNQYKHAAYIVATNDTNQWIEGSSASDTPKKIIGVIIQGRFTIDQWVKKYRLSCSNDGIVFYSLFGGQQFEGSTDRNTKVQHMFQTPVQARFIRFHPTVWNGHISFRIDFLIEEE